MLRRMLMAVAAIGALGLTSSAVAGGSDRNHDREKRHDLSREAQQAGRDRDRDGLSNLGELRARTDPRRRDTDEDGVRDGDENAGTITALAAGELTIRLFAGGDLTARVTDRTRVECEHGDRDDDHGHDREDDHGSDDGDDDSGHGSDDDSDRDSDDRGDDSDRDSDDRACPPGALSVGATVEEAELRITSAGRIWEEIELR